MKTHRCRLDLGTKVIIITDRIPKHLTSVASYPHLDLALSLPFIEKVQQINGSQMITGTRLRMDTEADQRPNLPGSMSSPFVFPKGHNVSL